MERDTFPLFPAKVKRLKVNTNVNMRARVVVRKQLQKTLVAIFSNSSFLFLFTT